MMYKSIKKSAATVVAVVVAAMFAAIFCTGCTDKEPLGGGEVDSTYVVTFDVNGGSGTTPNAIAVVRGSEITRLPDGSDLTKSGHTFGGWNTESGGGGTNYSAGSPYKPTGDITLYAKWNVHNVTGVVHGDPITFGGETYETVVIGEQTWFARNLNYAGGEGEEVLGLCPDDDPENCVKYGRMYDWNTAMTVCPAGSRLPTDDDWMELFNYVDPDGEVIINQGNQWGMAGQKLKAATGWNAGISGNMYDAIDEYGFAGLPGGRRTSGANGRWQNIGDRSNWWCATDGPGAEHGSTAVAYSFRAASNSAWRYDNNSVEDLHSVRCIKE